jgi:histidinol-phosphate aminotransferase
MAGMRCGFAIARPNLLEKLDNYGGWGYMPVTAVVAAAASLKDQQLVPERKRINATVREQTFQWLDTNGYPYIRSESNCFMVDTRRDGKEVIAAMAKQGVMVGRIWPLMPHCVRITVGTRPEMEQFQVAFRKVMTGAVTASVMPPRRGRRVLFPG